MLRAIGQPLCVSLAHTILAYWRSLLDGWVFVGYVHEHGEEREAAYRCRRCAESRWPQSVRVGMTLHEWDDG
jgi:hypothetical protein